MRSGEAEKLGYGRVGSVLALQQHRARDHEARHDGQIGEIVAVQENYASAYGLHERLPEWSKMEFQLRDWYHFNLSGDQTLQQLIHSIDKGSWALGDKPPLRAWAWVLTSRCAQN